METSYSIGPCSPKLLIQEHILAKDTLQEEDMLESDTSGHDVEGKAYLAQ
jgi:hypothetical protein